MTQYIIMELSENIQRVLNELSKMTDTQSRILEVLENIENKLDTENEGIN